MSEQKPIVVGVDYAQENCHEAAVEIYREKVQGIKVKYGVGVEPIPGQEIHRPSRERGQTPAFRPFDDSFLSGESSHQTSESFDIVGRGCIESALEFIPGEEPNVNSAYAAAYTRQSHAQALTHDEKARAFFTQQHTPGQLAGLKKLADDLVIATRPEPIEIKVNITIPSPELELDANGLPTTLESAMALDAVDALCAAEDERWKKEIVADGNLNPLEKQFRDGWDKIHAAEDEQFKKEIAEMEMDFSKEAIVEMLNEDLVAEGREPFYSVQMLSAQASAALRKKQKAGKKKKRK